MEETIATTTAPIATTIVIERGTKRTEISTIRDVSFNPNYGKNGSYILHGTPTKSNPRGIWAIDRKVFENQAAAAMVPPIVWAEQIKGAKYTVNSQAVKQGDTYLNGKQGGVYNKDHFAILDTKIERSEASVKNDRNIMMNAFYSNMFAGGNGTSQSAPQLAKVEAIPATGEGNVEASEIEA